MNGRAKILEALRKQAAHGAAHGQGAASGDGHPPLPSLEHDWIRYPDPHGQFAAVLELVGGRLIDVPPGGLAETVAGLPPVAEARRVASLVAAVPSRNWELAEIQDPHELADVDVAIARGELAVAENGAVWVHDQLDLFRALYFISQHLVLVVSRDRLVHNLHEAYQQLEFGRAGFGLFISGPSKTADIEQSLVIGAHGARSLYVLFE